MSGNSEQLGAVGAALRNGERDAAWQMLRPLVSFPSGPELSDGEWAQALGMFEVIGSGQMRPSTKTALTTARSAPTDTAALVALAEEMSAFELPRIAASALARAHGNSPDDPAILSQLATSFEAAALYQAAFELLRDAYVARKQDWTTRYHYVLTALLAGQIAAARQALVDLGDPADRPSALDQHVRSFAHVQALMARVDRLGGSSSLDEKDLRGWHYVICGGVLTHLSPHGFEQGMHGRYAMVNDQDGLVHEGVVRAVSVLRSWAIRPAYLVVSPDRSSQMLAEVWRQRIGIPVKSFEPSDTQGPGLFLAYDLATASENFLTAMAERRPGQVLVSHAQQWTQPQPFAADITTLLYQTNTPTWQDDPADPSQIASRIVATELEPTALADVEELSAFAEACGAPQPDLRHCFLPEGPVSSHRF